jgi:hypothetical protein
MTALFIGIGILDILIGISVILIAVTENPPSLWKYTMGVGGVVALAYGVFLIFLAGVWA